MQYESEQDLPLEPMEVRRRKHYEQLARQAAEEAEQQ